ncbi:MAG: hypothetical protein ACE3JK_05230, partial [Sporolactobacillus sp.]
LSAEEGALSAEEGALSAEEGALSAEEGALSAEEGALSAEVEESRNLQKNTHSQSESQRLKTLADSKE